MKQQTVEQIIEMIRKNDSLSSMEKDELVHSLEVLTKYNVDLNQDERVKQLLTEGFQLVKEDDGKNREDKLLEKYGLTPDSTKEEIESVRDSIIDQLYTQLKATKYIDRAKSFKGEIARVNTEFDLILSRLDKRTHSGDLSKREVRQEKADVLADLTKFVNQLSEFAVETEKEDEIEDIKNDAFNYVYEGMSDDEIKSAQDDLNSHPINYASYGNNNKEYLEPVEYFPNTNIRKPRAQGPFESTEHYNSFLAEYYSRYDFSNPQPTPIEETTKFYADKYSYVKDEIQDYFDDVRKALANLRWFYNYSINTISENDKDIEFYKGKVANGTNTDEFNKYIDEANATNEALSEFISEYDEKLDSVNTILGSIYNEPSLVGDTSITIELTRTGDELTATVAPLVTLVDDENRKKYANYEVENDKKIPYEEYTFTLSNVTNKDLDDMLLEFVTNISEEGYTDIDIDTFRNSNVELIVDGEELVTPFEDFGLNALKALGLKDEKNFVERSTYKNDQKILKLIDAHKGIESDLEDRVERVEEEKEVFQGEIGEGMPTPEEQFKQATGEELDADKYEVKYDGATNEENDESYTPFTVVEKDIEEPQQEIPVEVPELREDAIHEWDPRLTEEQILDAISRDIYEPVGPEYEQFLSEIGLAPIVQEEPKEETSKFDLPLEGGMREATGEAHGPENDIQDYQYDFDNQVDVTDEANEAEVDESLIEENTEEPIEEASQTFADAEPLGLPLLDDEEEAEEVQTPEEVVEENYDTAPEENEEKVEDDGIEEDLPIEEPTEEEPEELNFDEELADDIDFDAFEGEDEFADYHSFEDETEADHYIEDEGYESIKSPVRNKLGELDDTPLTQEELHNYYKVTAVRRPKNFTKTIAAGVVGGALALFGILATNPIVTVGGLAVLSATAVANRKNLFRAVQKVKLKIIAKKNGARVLFGRDGIKMINADGERLTKEKARNIQDDIDRLINSRIDPELVPEVKLKNLEDAFIIGDDEDAYYTSTDNEDYLYKFYTGPRLTTKFESVGPDLDMFDDEEEEEVKEEVVEEPVQEEQAEEENVNQDLSEGEMESEEEQTPDDTKPFDEDYSEAALDFDPFEDEEVVDLEIKEPVQEETTSESTESEIDEIPEDTLWDNITKHNEETYKVDIDPYERNLADTLLILNRELDGHIKEDSEGLYIECDHPEKLALPEGYEYINGVGISNIDSNPERVVTIDVVNRIQYAQETPEVSEEVIESIISKYGNILGGINTEDIPNYFANESEYSYDEIAAAIDKYQSGRTK